LELSIADGKEGGFSPPISGLYASVPTEFSDKPFASSITFLHMSWAVKTRATI
jgi:hypothetical protein